METEKMKLFLSNVTTHKKALYLILIILLCVAMLFAWFARWFRGWMHRDWFDRNFGRQNMMRNFNWQNRENSEFKNKWFWEKEDTARCPRFDNTNDWTWIAQSIQTRINNMKNELDLLYKDLNAVQSNTWSSK